MAVPASSTARLSSGVTDTSHTRGSRSSPMSVKSSKALADIRNLLAGTCPSPVGDEVTAANADSRSNAFAAAEGAPRPSLPPAPQPRTRGALAAQISRSAPPRSCTTRRCRSLSRRRCSARAEATSPRRARSLCGQVPRRAVRPRTSASSRSRPAWITFGGDRLTSRWRRSPSCSTASAPHDSPRTLTIAVCRGRTLASRRGRRALDYLHTRDRIFVVDGYAGWDPKYRVNVRVLCSRAYHALFMKNMLVRR